MPGGWHKNVRRRQSGVTVMELLIVVAIVGLLVSVTFPAVTSGMDGLRLRAAVDSITSFFNAALNRAERRQQVVLVTVFQNESRLTMRTTGSPERELAMPEGVSIAAVLPELPGRFQEDGPRRFFLYPGGSAPRMGILLKNRRGTAWLVRVNPITGVPEVERGEAP
jgi:prepilin-type N-terminal cleavage/methylation domain-containing protein